MVRNDFSAYEEDKKRRLGPNALEPKRIKHKVYTLIIERALIHSLDKGAVSIYKNTCTVLNFIIKLIYFRFFIDFLTLIPFNIFAKYRRL